MSYLRAPYLSTRSINKETLERTPGFIRLWVGQTNAVLYFPIFPALNAEGCEPVIALAVGFIAGPVLLGGYAWYLCRGPRRRGVSDEEIAQLQAIAEIERDEDPF
jgi:hypothetical protein